MAVLLLAAGLIERDGLFIFLGYVMIGVTLVYFGALAWAVLVLGLNLQDNDLISRIF